MSLVINKNGDPVHTPKRRDVFEWDNEVATIFDNMALRSIPMYSETHRIHASIIKRYAKDRLNFTGTVGSDVRVTIADIGASTGAFIKTLCHTFRVDSYVGVPNCRVVAIDSSDDMLRQISRSMHWVDTIQHDIEWGLDWMRKVIPHFDFVNVSYLLQFLDQGKRLPVLQTISKKMRSGGLIFISQKEAIENVILSKLFQDEYVQFRVDNGYTEEEIAAKTEALKGAMWVDTYEFTKELLEHAGFENVQPTTRWLNFSSMMAVKK